MAEPLDPAELPKSARWLAQAYDPPSGLVRFVAMTGQDYRDASFLDDRMFQQWRDVRTLPWPTVEQVMTPAEDRQVGWIFHIGHVGSTLIARMLGELDEVLSIREPRILRDLAMLEPGQRDAMAPTVRALLSRSFGDGQSVVVKATSFVSEIAPALMRCASKCIFLAAAPRAYIQTILAGENSRKELHHLEAFRAARMNGRIPAMVAQNDAELAAIAWACEMTSLEFAADRLSAAQVQWLDFDDFLADPDGRLVSCASHLRIEATADQASVIARGPLIHRYSKDLSFDYSPALRRELLAESAGQYRGEIEGALALLNETANHAPLLKRALDRLVRKD